MSFILSPTLYFRRNPTRTLPLVMVVSLAVILIASVVTIVRSIDLTVYTLYGYNRYLTGLTPRNVLAIDEEAEAKIKKLPQVLLYAPAHSYQTQIKTIFGKMVFPVFGLEAEARTLLLERCGVTLSEGKMPKESEAEAVIPEDVAKNIGVKVGDTLLGPELEDQYAPITVKLVGLLRGPVWVGLTSKSVVDQNSPFTWQGALVFAKTPALQRELDAEIVRLVPKSKARVWTFAVLQRETRNALQNLYLILDLIVAIIVFAIAFVCALLSNIYYTQRLPEIGTLAALGFTRAQLLRRSFGETAWLCGLGWLIGVTLTVTLLMSIKAVVLSPRGLLLDPVDWLALLFTLPLPIAITLTALVTVSLRLKALDPVSIIERRG
ncbi:MAG: hypothetical protein H7308_08545 [Chthonomonadaceae bacterium]|nr:hypothetical protein [Chthonomonadaceae bacterium]